jgi:hypothetical protein
MRLLQGARGMRENLVGSWAAGCCFQACHQDERTRTVGVSPRVG